MFAETGAIVDEGKTSIPGETSSFRVSAIVRTSDCSPTGVRVVEGEQESLPLFLLKVMHVVVSYRIAPIGGPLLTAGCCVRGTRDLPGPLAWGLGQRLTALISPHFARLPRTAIPDDPFAHHPGRIHMYKLVMVSPITCSYRTHGHRSSSL